MKTSTEICNEIQNAIKALGLPDYELSSTYLPWIDKCAIRGHQIGFEVQIDNDNFEQALKCITSGNAKDLGSRLKEEVPGTSLFALYGGVDKSYYTPSNGWYNVYEGETSVISVMGGDYIGYARGSRIEWVKQ